MNELSTLAYLAVLALLMPFGAHRLRLLWLRFRRPRPREAARWTGRLPIVTVQLPVYNEANVIERLIDAACAIDYPADRLEIQVLDDSDDETVAVAGRRIRAWRARGIDVLHLRRDSREEGPATTASIGAIQRP